MQIKVMQHTLGEYKPNILYLQRIVWLTTFRMSEIDSSSGGRLIGDIKPIGHQQNASTTKKHF
jgi:hypothetical protein